MIIAVDFDGTIVEHEYPKIGKLCPGSIEVLKALVACGNKLILYTMRSGKELAEACDLLSKHGVSLYGVNKNPTQFNWTKSPKVYAQLYIDDAALGCPLVYPSLINSPNRRAYVDWSEVSDMLSMMSIGYEDILDT
jgi:hypothetical protein